MYKILQSKYINKTETKSRQTLTMRGMYQFPTPFTVKKWENNHLGQAVQRAFVLSGCSQKQKFKWQ